ncbi:hypothetical protein D3C72_1749360 [compost metagenome]
MRPIQASRQQWRQCRLLTWRQQQRLLHGLINSLLRPYLKLGQALEYFVAGHLCACRVTVRTQAARRLGQYREHGRFRRGQVLRRFAQVRPTGCCHTLQGTAKRGAIEVDLQDLRLRQVPLQLRRAPQLA